MNGFLWKSGTEEKGGIRWISWQKACVCKEDWGLGFHELHHFNFPMPLKTGWNLLTRPEDLVSELFQARYYHKSNFLDAGLGSNRSFGWHSLCAGKQILEQVCLRCIGNRKTTRVYINPWLPKDNSSYVESSNFLGSENCLGLM
ncbi:hypothetical protein T459_27072 [Capsicum annuum]|uniref:Uncharacterized protein n=1 Tax=Capsicum annuum TaxID=4072 RepID=A0A2G2YCW4_CAPAN|nr:hypothetical protein T459_27072 [Capsicum annuum]